MRTTYAVALMLTVVLAGTYVFSAVAAVCKTPITYRIGQFDERFSITEDEARIAIAEAESAWEEATGKNLFTYDPEGRLVINFVFDERQEFAEAEMTFRERLNAAEGVNEAIRDTYSALVDEYAELEAHYRERAATYEDALSAYNAQVEKYNTEGGAPPEEYGALEEERDRLDRELASLNDLGDQLNALVDEINRLSEQGNQLVERYNEHVGSYNERFAETHEFTQGDYQAGTIQIYKFIDMTELKLVLAHELGHALALGHVEGDDSIMYHLMGGQPADTVLTDQDLAEYERVCGATARSWAERLFIAFDI